MLFLHKRYRQELSSRIAAQYLESRIRSKIDKTHITPLGEKAISPNNWLTYPRDPYNPLGEKAVSPNDWLIKLYSEHSAPIVLSSLGSVPQAF